MILRASRRVYIPDCENPKIALGSTGFKATLLGIGDLADRSVPLETCVATIHRAMDSGLNLIDTGTWQVVYENCHLQREWYPLAPA